ncbi:hypothetical protein TanjilG_21491 [Lupinus angustifolius]|uniref:Bet v I/Major latex protein domain-containing protein n=1 Tax=Lupinus angustifolius TaxID=3871 RepID=A0A4P1QU61_LUPAN|nr:PREDICTED: MLP-like protein 34 [Lupinus angustifolius]OIV95101.1 hypothetical protein TanjilG_21491 [Lupinus angustifolius]
MALSGKVSIEFGIQATISQWFNLFHKNLSHVQNICERVHQAHIHEGDWHTIGSVKNWTFIIDGKPVKHKEKIEAIDENKKTITWSFFDDDLGQQYKVFILTMELNEKDDGSYLLKWTIEYELVNENVEPPYSYLDFLNKSSKHVDDYLVGA